MYYKTQKHNEGLRRPRGQLFRSKLFYSSDSHSKPYKEDIQRRNHSNYIRRQRLSMELLLSVAIFLGCFLLAMYFL